MSRPTPSQPSHTGSVGSYVIGFILSLEFTAIPYYMVVNQIVSGNALLATILSFAVLQMLVQIIFFLHLGRGPKPLYNIAFFVFTVGAILVVTVGSVFIMSNLHGRMAPSEVTQKLAQDENISRIGDEQTGACQGTRNNHQVVITDGSLNVPFVEAERCDTLTFINNDAIDRQLTFGPHPEHAAYGGETDVTVTNRRPKTITLNQTGTFMFHDHQAPTLNGYFSVKQ